MLQHRVGHHSLEGFLAKRESFAVCTQQRRHDAGFLKPSAPDHQPAQRHVDSRHAQTPLGSRGCQAGGPAAQVQKGGQGSLPIALPEPLQAGLSPLQATLHGSHVMPLQREGIFGGQPVVAVQKLIEIGRPAGQKPFHFALLVADGNEGVGLEPEVGDAEAQRERAPANSASPVRRLPLQAAPAGGAGQHFFQPTGPQGRDVI
ncbi:MAG: hypothetical protein V3T83_19265 [Acidobacteriota bacterium]